MMWFCWIQLFVLWHWKILEVQHALLFSDKVFKVFVFDAKWRINERKLCKLSISGGCRKQKSLKTNLQTFGFSVCVCVCVLGREGRKEEKEEDVDVRKKSKRKKNTQKSVFLKEWVVYVCVKLGNTLTLEVSQK